MSPGRCGVRSTRPNAAGKQIAFNAAHGITPQTVQKNIADIMEAAYPGAHHHGPALARVANRRRNMRP